MTAVLSPLFDQFSQAVADSLSHFNNSNALFLAERLNSVVDSEPSRILLAETYLSDQKFYSAYSVLKSQKSQRALYLFAVSCFKIGRFAEAEEALAGHELSPQGHFLLGQVLEKLDKKSSAIIQYKKAFTKDPRLVVALERYSILLAPNKSGELDSLLLKLEESKLVSEKEISQSQIYFKNRSSNIGSLHTSRSPDVKVRLDQILKNESKSKNDPLTSLKPNAVFSNRSSTSKANISEKDAGTPRTGTLLANKGKFNTVSKQLKPSNSLVKQPSINPKPDSIFDILSVILKPYVTFLVKTPDEALPQLKAASQELPKDSWLKLLLGRCYTELYDHSSAEKEFKECFDIDPHKSQGLDFYSSCLWHLKKTERLTEIVSKAVERHFFAPETWVAMANCYSLKQDHDSAIVFLNRALQLDPNNSYSYCLLGHEYLAKDNFDKARENYVKAMGIDSKNVRAIWGLGILDSKSEKFDRAIHYFKKALAINDKCAPFYTQLALSYLNLHEFEKALVNILKAESLTPTDRYAKYIKAQILMKMGRLDQALIECKNLIFLSPKEAPLYLLLGHINQLMGNNEEAFKNLSYVSVLEKKDTRKYKNMLAGMLENDNSY